LPSVTVITPTSAGLTVLMPPGLTFTARASGTLPLVVVIAALTLASRSQHTTTLRTAATMVAMACGSLIVDAD
jgi:hypothetical protein